MSKYAIQPLNAATWNAFAQLARKDNGVWNGCWCTWFHPASAERGLSSEGNRAYKERLMRGGKAHAALVFDGAVAVARCHMSDLRAHRTPDGTLNGPADASAQPGHVNAPRGRRARAR